MAASYTSLSFLEIHVTVQHILLDCPDLQAMRQKYFTAFYLKDISESVDNRNIVGFIKDAYFNHQL